MATNDVQNMSIDEEQFFRQELSHASPPADRRTLKLSTTPATEYSPSLSSRGGEEEEDDYNSVTASPRVPPADEDSPRKIWVPLPSPCRPLLDPKYAARLAPHTPFSPPAAADKELMPPPGIHRDANFFRPSPVVTMHLENEAVDTTRVRFNTPATNRKRVFFPDVGVSDRYICSRAASSTPGIDLWGTRTRRPKKTSTTASYDTGDSTPSSTATTASQSQQNLLSTLLRSELLGENQNPVPTRISQVQNAAQQHHSDATNQLRFRSPRQHYSDQVLEDLTTSDAAFHSFSLTPIRSPASQRLMAAPPKRKRRISKVPFKVLDAPALQDDFYLNLVDWSSQNVLAVGLGSCV